MALPATTTNAVHSGVLERSNARQALRIAKACLFLAALLGLASCTGDVDQREEIARSVFPGGGSLGTVANPTGDAFVRGAVSIGGVVRNALVVLRPVNEDGSVDWAEESVLGQGVTFDNGIYQVFVQKVYRGPILVEVRAQNAVGVVSDGGNPATATSGKFHAMGPEHVLYSVLPWFEGTSSGQTHVTPLTTFAVARSLSFDGSIAGVQGGISAGLFGLTCQQTARFLGIGAVRASLPADFSASGGFGTDVMQAYALAALSQLARNVGVANVWDFWLGLTLDGMDDGVANGSIGFVPGTGIAMPDLTQAGLIGNALLNDYLAPANPDRLIPENSTNLPVGGAVLQLVAFLNTSRDINASTVDYDIVLRVPEPIMLAPGAQFHTCVLACQRIGGGTDFHPFGDSAGPSFVEFSWVSSSPGQVSVQPFGVIAVDAGAPIGDYTLQLSIQPLAGQTFVIGPPRNFEIVVRVR